MDQPTVVLWGELEGVGSVALAFGDRWQIFIIPNIFIFLYIFFNFKNNNKNGASNNFLTTFLKLSYNFLTTFSQFSKNFHTTFLQLSYNCRNIMELSWRFATFFYEQAKVCVVLALGLYWCYNPHTLRGLVASSMQDSDMIHSSFAKKKISQSAFFLIS